MIKKFLLLVFVFLLAIVVAGYWFYKNIGPVSSNKNFSSFLISKGQSASFVASKLESAGLIKNAYTFRIYLRITGQSAKIQTGEFRLSPSMSLFQIVDQLQKGPIELWVTIPEGLRREEIATRFAANLDKDQSFVADFLKNSQGEEGYLFPDTYLFPKDVTAAAVVKKMLANFDVKTNSLKFTKEQIILASILERETKTDEERPIVAGILMNRLNIGMPLQVDATVQYTLGTSKDWWPTLFREDLKVNSKFNTYKFAGLPPSPIANPGISSITAAVNPTDNDYFYYIHDTEGNIHYAKTLDEHNSNVAKYLR